MQTTLHTSPAIFDTLSDEWDGLLHPGRSDNFFLTCDWQRIWWKHLCRGELSVITIRDDAGELRGVAPWFIEEDSHRQVVRAIGCIDVTDYLETVLMPDYEEQALAAILDFMLSADAPQWDIIDLCNIPQTSPTLTRLPDLAESRGLTVEVGVQDVCPVVHLPDTYEDYLATLDKKQRHELRRKRRRAELRGIDWYVVGPEHDLGTEIDTFLELMAMSSPQKAAFLEVPGNRSFFKEIGAITFNQDTLKLYFLTVDGQPAAAMWQFAYRDRMLLYNSGLNPNDFAGLSAGIVLLTYSVEDAIQRGFKKYDFLRGDEIYKYRMGAEDTTVHNVVIQR